MQNYNLSPFTPVTPFKVNSGTTVTAVKAEDFVTLAPDLQSFLRALPSNAVVNNISIVIASDSTGWALVTVTYQ